MTFRLVQRGGVYHRVCKPEWTDCADRSFSKLHGGRWNPPGEFGALYLCATTAVAAAFVRAWHANRAISLFSLRPNRRPQLQGFDVTPARYVDLVTAAGVEAAGLPARFPFGVGWEPCQDVARRAYAAKEAGIAARSSSECGPSDWIGEELAVFDRAAQPRARGTRRPFTSWYPDQF